MMTEPFRILFVCTGNHCRSPIGESLLRHYIQEKQIEEKKNQRVEIFSAGTIALEGIPASREAIVAVEKLGANLDHFRSQILTEELVDRADLILVMEYVHLDFIEEHYPTHADKVRILGQFLYPRGPEEIFDPMGGSQDLFDDVVSLIDHCLMHLLQEWDSIVKRYYSPKQKVIAIGVDHRGFHEKEWLKSILEAMGTSVIDCGTMTPESCDHPDYAFKASELVSWGQADRTVLICGTGHGMLLAANRVFDIRCIMPLNEEHAILSRSHNNANALAFGADFHSKEFIENITRIWLNTPFLGGKYQKRIRKITEYGCKSKK